jgi:hypothetical protein
LAAAVWAVCKKGGVCLSLVVFQQRFQQEKALCFSGSVAPFTFSTENFRIFILSLGNVGFESLSQQGEKDVSLGFWRLKVLETAIFRNFRSFQFSAK